MEALLLNNTKTNEMKPNLKAKELAEEFENELLLTKEGSKKAATIVVNEILDAIKNFPYGIEYLCVRDYYEEVREEIQKL